LLKYLSLYILRKKKASGRRQGMPAVPNLIVSKPKRGAAMRKKLRAWDFADEEVFQ